jgi:hypothetical protein
VSRILKNVQEFLHVSGAKPYGFLIHNFDASFVVGRGRFLKKQVESWL